MVRRPFITLLCLLSLSACADPPGMKKPLPLNFNEQSYALDVYRGVAQQAKKLPGVAGTYLTQTNNPREIVIVVTSEAAIPNLEQVFHTSVRGVPVRYEVSEKGFAADQGNIEAVPKQDLPRTWWDKVMYYFMNFASRVLPVDGPDGPPPSVDPKTLKAT